ncbi:MAG TPA: ABC transporter permease [Jatrophihabitans sp.]|nr:ABC transporter permease [Jatrophihabitans sp.]
MTQNLTTAASVSDATTDRDNDAGKNSGWRRWWQPTLAVYTAPVILFVVVGIKLPSIFSKSGLLSVLVLAAVLGIACIGQTLAILIGGIDLSIPATIGLANVLVATLTLNHWSFPSICLVLFGLSIVIGVVNGVLSSLFNLHPLVVTLGTGSIITGGILEHTHGNTGGVVPHFIVDAVSPVGRSFGLPIPASVLIWLVLAVLVLLIERRTTIGRRIFALGANPTAAPLSLVNPVVTRIVVYTVGAISACISGVLLAGFSGGASADIGQPYLFSTITAVVVGGTALIGGRGGYGRTIAGAFITIEVQTLLIGLKVGVSMQQVFLGLIILALVATYGRERSVAQRI